MVPGANATDRVSRPFSDYNWAPRWKATANLGWNTGAIRANVAGRFIGKYRDYEPLADGTYLNLGSFWVCDANIRFDAGKSLASGNSWLSGTYVELGAVNLFNNLPQFSNTLAGTGFDGTQADLRGRFLYGKIGFKW